jgi:hypothetical protein
MQHGLRLWVRNDVSFLSDHVGFGSISDQIAYPTDGSAVAFVLPLPEGPWAGRRRSPMWATLRSATWLVTAA